MAEVYPPVQQHPALLAFAEALGNTSTALRSDDNGDWRIKGSLPKPIGLGLDDVEDILSEGLDHLLGIDRPDAPDHPRAQIFLDPVD